MPLAIARTNSLVAELKVGRYGPTGGLGTILVILLILYLLKII